MEQLTPDGVVEEPHDRNWTVHPTGKWIIGNHPEATPEQLKRPEEAKIAAIKALQPPTSVKRLQAHLGLFNYYRCYVPNFSIIAQPLYKLLQKGAQYIWTSDCQEAYDAIKAALSKPGLALRQPVDDLPYHLYVDWSNSGIAAVLNQREDDGEEFMVACASRSLNPAEKNYPAWKGARLDYDVQDWPLPAVLDSSMQPDTTVYTHDSLSQLLGVTDKVKSAKRAAVGTAAALLAHAMASEPQSSPSWAQLSHDVLHCLLASNATSVDAVIPSSASLLGGGMGALFSQQHAEQSDVQHPAVAWKQQDLQRAASAWVTLAALQHPAPGTTLPGTYIGTKDGQGVKPTQQLNTTSCAATFFPNALEHGLVLWEPFGGLCAGLEMALRNGFTVQQYYYGDIDPVAQRVAQHRVRTLQSMYPRQLSESALQGAFSRMPMDITQVTTAHVATLVKKHGPAQWLVVAGWPCQDLSMAGCRSQS